MRKYLISGIIILLIILIFAVVQYKPGLSQGTCPTPNLNYYTSYPPFITSTSTQPNVMLVVDNSGSMFNFAYFDGWTTTTTSDDNMCNSFDNYCTGFTEPGTYPTFKYYGYFDPDYWYLYSTGRFYPTAPKTGSGLPGARDKTPSEWDGNFLNWLSMRRVDIVRKVLTGGLVVATGGENRLITEIADYYGRGIYKQITNAENYIPSSYSGTRTFTFRTAGSNPSKFVISGVSGAFDVRVATVGNITPTGIVQNMWTSVRWGLSYYHPNTPTPQGGYVYASVNQLSQSSFVNGINNKRPNSNTPLAETLWTNVGYFAQTTSWLGGPGPRYQSGDYTVNNLNDPYNYGTGGSPSYLSCSKSFVLYITDGEPCADGYLPSTLSDYASGRSPYNCQGSSCPAVGNFPASTFPSCYGGGEGGYVAGIEDVALFAHTNDIRTEDTKNISGTQTLTIYPVFAFGKGSTLLRYTAINGGFIDSNGNNTPDLQSEWDADGDGEPDNFFETDEGYELESSLLTALNDILNRASSGAAASVLASTGEGEGAVYQAYFIPGAPGSAATEANWRGYVQALFLDKYGNIREDTNSNDTLDYTSDNIVKMFFDTDVTPSRTRVRRYSDTDGDGQTDALIDTVELSSITPIWEGGRLLWSTDPDERQIFTTINGYSYSGLSSDSTQGTFLETNAPTLRPYIRASTAGEAMNIINYIRGSNISGYRTRSFTIGGTTNTWKLGDIIYSTPTLVSKPAENLDLIYADSTYAAFAKKYANRRHMLYVGANDGMLHAFNAGVFNSTTLSYSGDGYTLGEELWAFIPRELLPHLKWLTDPDYTHVYYVDLKPKVTDVRIFESEFNNPDGTHPYGWGTILIGGMRFGGKEICVTDDFGSGTETRTFRSSYFAIDITDPLNPELLWTFTHEDLGLTTSYPAVLRVGLRDEPGTYFVVFGSGPTDYDGTSTQRGRIFTLKISGSSNGVISSWTAGSNYWESGADFLTGGDNAIIDNYAFMADPVSIDFDLNYKADVIYIGNTYCDNPIDPLNPEKCSSSNWKGKMYRIATKPSAISEPSANPSDWKLSVLFNAQQPISTYPNAGVDERGNLWTFFGTGRFWHTDDRALDGTERWSFYGVKDTCKPWLDPLASACGTVITNADLLDVSNAVVSVGGGTVTGVSGVTDWTTLLSAINLKKGWYLNFPTAGERALSRPLVIGGLVAWTSYIPNPDDPCALEGNSRLYATYYETGTAYHKYVFEQEGETVFRSIDLGVGVPSAVGVVITGSNTVKGFVQQSTGTIVEIGKTTPFGLKSRLLSWKEK